MPVHFEFRIVKPSALKFQFGLRQLTVDQAMVESPMPNVTLITYGNVSTNQRLRPISARSVQRQAQVESLPCCSHPDRLRPRK